MNALARRDAAIVSDEPGTTRDLVELALDLNGVKVRLTDTAGIREGAGKVETIGIERARQRAETADLVLLLDRRLRRSPDAAVGRECRCYPHRDKGRSRPLRFTEARPVSAASGSTARSLRMISSEMRQAALALVSAVSGRDCSNSLDC